MNTFGRAICVAAGMVFLAASAFPQGEKEGQGQIIVTILPKHEGDPAPVVLAQGATVKVNGKDTRVTSMKPLTDMKDPVELVVLIDGSARTSLARQFQEIEQFVKSLPPNVRATIGYMQNGRTTMAGGFSTDHQEVLRGLHIPVGSAGSNGSPYFCLSDLAKSWPSQDRGARREVLMITDGVDEFNRRYDPDDPYVQAAMTDAARARLVVYSIYWRNQGRADNTSYENNAGQNLLVQLTESTGGKSFWEGTGNPVSFQPYLEELTRRLQNQYELSFLVPIKGKPEVETLKLKFKVPGAEVDAPQQVFVAGPGVVQE
jgi:hypothetical protein